MLVVPEAYLWWDAGKKANTNIPLLLKRCLLRFAVLLLLDVPVILFLVIVLAGEAKVGVHRHKAYTPAAHSNLKNSWNGFHSGSQRLFISPYFSSTRFNTAGQQHGGQGKHDYCSQENETDASSSTALLEKTPIITTNPKYLRRAGTPREVPEHDHNISDVVPSESSDILIFSKSV